MLINRKCGTLNHYARKERVTEQLDSSEDENLNELLMRVLILIIPWVYSPCSPAFPSSAKFRVTGNRSAKVLRHGNVDRSFPERFVIGVYPNTVANGHFLMCGGVVERQVYSNLSVTLLYFMGWGVGM